jgi:hypothetical protein
MTFVKYFIPVTNFENTDRSEKPQNIIPGHIFKTWPGCQKTVSENVFKMRGTFSKHEYCKQERRIVVGNDEE